jgi:hypothetical protein
MLRLRMVAFASGLALLAFGAANAQAQDVPPGEPDMTTQPDSESPEAYEQMHPDAPTPAHTGDGDEIHVHPPAPQVDVNVPPPVITEPAPVYVEERPVSLTVIEQPRPRNMSLALGGGVSNFVDGTLQSRTGLQGAYEARLAIGASSLIGLEAAYVGTAGGIDTLGLDDDAMLISNGVEALARVNIGTSAFQPFIVGGGSWIRYNVVNASFNTSDVRNEDDVLAIPFGAGVATYLGDSGLMLDGRFIYRATFDDELIRPTPGNSNGSSLNNWVATLRLGYAF